MNTEYTATGLSISSGNKSLALPVNSEIHTSTVPIAFHSVHLSQPSLLLCTYVSH